MLLFLGSVAITTTILLALILWLTPQNYSYMLHNDVIWYGPYHLSLQRYPKELWIKVINGEDLDVTDEILNWAGRDQNFYHVKTKISTILRGCKKLTFIYETGVDKTFTEYIEF